MAKTTFRNLIQVMQKLRSPSGCPWDREQTHESLLKYLREESQEMVQAVRKKDWINLEEELGDVLLQVLFHSQLAAERGDFTIHDVLATLKSKLVGRHPHVFGRRKNLILTAQDVKDQWGQLKKAEKEKRLRERLRRKKKKVP